MKKALTIVLITITTSIANADLTAYTFGVYSHNAEPGYGVSVEAPKYGIEFRTWRHDLLDSSTESVAIAVKGIANGTIKGKRVRGELGAGAVWNGSNVVPVAGVRAGFVPLGLYAWVGFVYSQETDVTVDGTEYTLRQAVNPEVGISIPVLRW